MSFTQLKRIIEMKAELVKRQDRWDLYLIADGSKIASTLPNPMNKLSIKNCQAIENGYDLDELAGDYANKELNEEFTSKVGNFYGFSSSFTDGFQKALEILGDKKFSEEDLKLAFFHVQNEPTFAVFKESLQQTEWDVTFNPDEKDSEGCLILKRNSYVEKN